MKKSITSGRRKVDFSIHLAGWHGTWVNFRMFAVQRLLSKILSPQLPKELVPVELTATMPNSCEDSPGQTRTKTSDAKIGKIKMHPDCTVLRCTTVSNEIMKLGTRTEKWSRVKKRMKEALPKSPKKLSARVLVFLYIQVKILLNMFGHCLTSTCLSNANCLAPRCKGIHQPRDAQMDRNPSCGQYCLHDVCGRNAKITSQFLPKRLTTGFTQAKHVLRVIYSLREAYQYTYSHTHTHHIWSSVQLLTFSWQNYITIYRFNRW